MFRSFPIPGPSRDAYLCGKSSQSFCNDVRPFPSHTSYVYSHGLEEDLPRHRCEKGKNRRDLDEVRKM